MDAALRASDRFCARVARRQAKNFAWSFYLLPAGRRRAMRALYAFMRHTDDLTDEPGPPEAKAEALARWRADLARALAGAPDAWPGLPALAEAARRFAIPKRHLEEVIDGVEMDVTPRRFATFEDLHGYCYKVASAVGLCCLPIWGYDPAGGRAEARAEECGVALQLTNILRDVSEDAQAGRIYLPTEDLDRFGVAPEALATGPLDDRMRALLAFQAERAKGYYERSAPLVRLVHPVGRPALRAIVGIYRALLDEIEARGYDVFAGRVRVPAWKKAAITAGALVGRGFHRRERGERR